MGKRKEGLKQLTLWLDEKVLAGAEAEAAQTGVPRTIVIENALRAKLGLPPREDVDPRTPLKYIEAKPRVAKKKKV